MTELAPTSLDDIRDQLCEPRDLAKGEDHLGLGQLIRQVVFRIVDDGGDDAWRRPGLDDPSRWGVGGDVLCDTLAPLTLGGS